MNLLQPSRDRDNRDSIRFPWPRGENGVASDIRDGLRKGLDKERYHIETDDGEDVLVKKRKGPNFELKLVSSTVKSVRFDIEKE